MIGMATYTVNDRAKAHARKLIKAKQYVLESDWASVNRRQKRRTRTWTDSWDDYSLWHLGLTDGAADQTKARYAFVFGDLRQVHRSALIACVYRASEWRHKAVELAAHELLQLLDTTSS